MAMRYAQPRLTDSAKIELSKQKLSQDVDIRSRWDELRKALALRYSSPAEAFVAFGGRTDKVLVMGELDRALREVRSRMRTVRPPININVEGLMDDTIKLFPEGLAFEDFVEYLNWHQAKKPPSPKAPGRAQQGRPSVLRSSSIGKLDKPHPKVMVGAPANALRSSNRDLGHNFYGGPLSGGVLSAQWRGSKGPPAHWMVRQRQAASRQAAENVFSDDKKVLRHLKLERKMQVLSETEERLRAMLEEPQPPVVREEEEKPLIIPMESQEEPEYHPEKRVQLSSEGQSMKERLASIDSLVTEQKLSLAETERNILKRERQDLHAQIRQMDAMHRQNQMDMQKQMKDQMESLMETFQNVGKVMLGGIQTAQQGAETPAEPQVPLRERSVEDTRQLSVAEGGDAILSPRALEQQRKQERMEREAVFERRLRTELLEPYSTAQIHAHSRPPIESGGNTECMIARRRDADDRLLGSGLVQELCSQLEITSPAVSCFPQSFRPDIGDIRSINSPALRALRSSCVFVPICSWYDRDDTGTPNEGSVGRLARMDPVNGEDWVDEFLVEVLVALRLEQEFPSSSRIGWIMPILLGGQEPKSCDVSFGNFPWERLKQLPSHPSLESSKIVAQVLADCGVATPEGFLRLSVRDTVSAVIGFAGVQLDSFPSRSEAVPALARRMADMVAAERSAREAKSWQDGSHMELEPAKAERELKKLKRSALDKFEGCYREVRENGARTLAVSAMRRRGLLGDGDVDAELEDTGKDAGEEEDAWMDVSWHGEPEAIEKSDWERFGRHWDSLEHTLGGEDSEGSQGKQEESRVEEESCDEPADIEDVLRKLQAAVAETHDKHSQLLQVTRDAKRLDNLAGGLSEAGREALRNSGITFSDLIEMTRKDTGDGAVVFNATALPKIGLDPKPASPDMGPQEGKQSKHDAAMVEKFMMAPHLWDREGEWGSGGGTDENERKERLREDLEALQGHLKRKGAKTHISSQAVQELMKDDGTSDGICGVLNSLLLALGKGAGPQGSELEQMMPPPAARTPPGDEASVPAPGDVGEKKTAEGSPAPGDDTTAEIEDEDSYVDRGTEEGIGRLDKEMADYLEKLEREEDAQHEVMQYLTSGLAEVRASAERAGGADIGYGDNLEAGMERKRMEASQMAMEKTMKRFEEAMSNAKRLLSSDTASEKDAEVVSTGGGAVSGGLTAAEQETVKLEEDMRRRAEQSEALAKENMMLREQLSRGRAGRGHEPDGRDGPEEEVKIHWSEAIQDPELASKYKGYGDSEDAYFVAGSGQDSGQLDTRFLRPEMLQYLLNASNGEAEQPHLAWALEKVNSLSHITRASVFETVLEERVRKSKKVLQAKADSYAKELELIQSEEAEALAALERVLEEQAAMVREGAKAAKGAVVMLKEREVRVAKERCDELAAKRGEVEQELQRLAAEEEALDWRAELERMKEKEEEECEPVRAEIERIKEEAGGEESEERKALVAELEKKLMRIQETWLLRRNLKEKEIEIEVLGQKMEDDEEGLKLEKKRLMNAFQENANTAQEELTHSLVDMEAHVAKTARGRCRPEVMSSLSGVRKVMGAVQKHRAEMALAMEEERRQEREKLKEQHRAEMERIETAKLEEEIARARGTTDMVLREKRLQLIADLVAKQRQATLQSATSLLEDGEKALAAGSASEGGSQPRFEKMQLRTVEGGAKHARTFVVEAKKLLLELQSAAITAAGGAADAGNPDSGGGDEESGAAVRERLERLETVEKAVDEAEERLSEQMREAQTKVEKMQKLDLAKASRDEVKEVAEERDSVTALIKDLGELQKVGDANKVKGRDFATREQRLKTAWDRLAPRIEEALRKILVKGDSYLDSVQAALKAGKVSSAVAELGNAQQAYDKFKAAKTPSQPAAPSKS